jgi:hypothetical protein
MDNKLFSFADAFVLSNYERDPVLIRLLQPDKVRECSNLITTKVGKFNIYNKPVIVPDDQVRQAIEYFYINQYIPSLNYVFSYEYILESVSDSYVQQILDDFNQTHANDDLDIWVTRYDGTRGLKSHSQVKIKEKTLVTPVSISNRY